MSKIEEIHGSILFIDIVGSSNKWKVLGDIFFEELKKFENYIIELCKTYDACLVKMIGDAFMIKFDQLSSALEFAIILQTNIMTKIKDTNIQIRIGIAEGKLRKKMVQIQNCEQVDFFGKTVNIASRMESKVSKPDGFAVTMGSYNEEKENRLISILTDIGKRSKCDISIHVKHYITEDSIQEELNKDPRVERIDVLLAKDLKGVGELRAYDISLYPKTEIEC